MKGRMEPTKVLRGRLSGLVVIDKTLTIPGAGADAEAVGKAIALIYEKMEPKIKTLTAVLSAMQWSDHMQSISVPGATADNTILLSPAPADRIPYYYNGISGVAQRENVVTFSCETIPEVDVAVNIIIFSPGVPQ